MIYTLTLNPALDYVMETGKLETGITNRSMSEDIFYGGKGINVSVVLSRLGVKNKALGFLAGFTGKELLKELKKEKVKTDFTFLKNGLTRINVKLKGEEETEINSSGPDIPQKEISRLIKRLNKLKKDDILVLSGSVPKSVDSGIYERIMKELYGKGIKIIVDTTRNSLIPCLKYNPFLIKPNKQELEEIAGRELKTKEEIVDAARCLKDMGAENVLVSLGGDGAILVDENDCVYIEPAKRVTAVNTVGAGDSMIAGFIAGVNKGYKYALSLAIASGSATAASTHLATKEKIYELLKD